MPQYRYTRRILLFSRRCAAKYATSVAIAHLGLYTSDIGWGQWVNIIHESL